MIKFEAQREKDNQVHATTLRKGAVWRQPVSYLQSGTEHVSIPTEGLLRNDDGNDNVSVANQ